MIQSPDSLPSDLPLSSVLRDPWLPDSLLDSAPSLDIRACVSNEQLKAASPMGEIAIDENDIIIACVDIYVTNSNTKLSRQCNWGHRLGEEHCEYRRYHIT